MFHDDRSPAGPASAEGDAIILHVPSCVQQFSSRRRILSRLRALARRRSQGVPEVESGPPKLQVEENPDWPQGEEWRAEALLGDGGDSTADEDRDAGLLLPGLEVLDSSGGTDEPVPILKARTVGTAASAPEDPNALVIQRLMEDNRDLKAALCRLIRISEQNHAALRLLEEENEELSALAHRLTTGQVGVSTAVGPVGGAAAPSGPWWAPAWGVEWLRRWQAR